MTISIELDGKDIGPMNVLIDEITRTVSSNIIVNNSFHEAVPVNLVNEDLTKIVMELKNDVETNLSLYSRTKH